MPTPEEIEAERVRAEAEAAENQNQPATNTNIDELIRTTLAESNRRANAAEARNRELEDRLNAASNHPVPNGNTLPAVTNEQFWANPVESLNALINSQVAPIIQTTAAMKRRDMYVSLKNNYRSQYPAFAQIENLVDRYMEGQEPTNANINIAIERAVGSLALSNPSMFNQPPVNNNNQNNQPPAANNNNPPPPARIPDPQAHLRSTPTPVNNGNNPPKRRALNEFERRLAKQQNMTEDRYLDLLEGNNTVETWKEKK